VNTFSDETGSASPTLLAIGLHSHSSKNRSLSYIPMDSSTVRVSLS